MAAGAFRTSQWEARRFLLGCNARLRSGACLALAIIFCLTANTFDAAAQNVSIGTATANTSALLHLESTTKGFLIPRMSDAQMWAISSPYTSDIVFNTTYTNFYYYNGTIWTPLLGSGWSLTGDAGTVASTNFLGTKDAVDLVQKTNNTEHLRVLSTGELGLTNTNNTAEQLIFWTASSLGKYISFKAGIQTANIHYIWPLTGDGISNQVLVTDGAGNLSWHTFATFGGSGSQSLWKRGSAGGGEYADSSGDADSGPFSIVAGHSNSVTGNYEIVWGGNDNQGVSGSYGSVHGGSGNGSTGDEDVAFGGLNNTCGATACVIFGGSGNTTSGNEEAVLGGSGASFSGSNSTILGGINGKTSCNQELLYGYLQATAGTCASVIFKIGTHTRFGINNVAPAEFLDVTGNVRFSGALKPNGAGGTSGTTWLTSAGSGSPPTWGALAIAATNWKLLGNSATAPASNFVGTTDASALVIKTNATERIRISSGGQVGINTSSPVHQLQSTYTGTTDEIAAIQGKASGSSAANQMVGVWGRANNTGSSNTGTIAVLAEGSGNTTAGQTNISLQISGGEFTMGRTTESPSKGTVVSGAANGTTYTAQGPSGMIQLSLGTDFSTAAPIAGVYQNLGTMTINNRYITASSIIRVNVVDKADGGGIPSPKNSVYIADVESRAAGSCVVHLALIPFVTELNNYQGSDNITIAYSVVNAGR
jgi:hypothetical protein